MCEYVQLNKCSISGEVCPFMYYCNKLRIWKPLKSMPEKCNIKENFEIPKGYCKVRFERKGYLYVDINNQTFAIKNPFDDVPKYVKATKTKNGWRLRK